EQFVGYIESKGVPKTGMVFTRRDQEEEAKPVDTNDMPVFTFQEAPLADDLGRVTVDVILMAVLSLAFFVGAYVSFLRYDVR
ncbi:MAG: hypothetical protein QGI83_13470, partial [Candidatus Latescibacteria bacterium]|nr:hypothetical protein [Candidatus Latescibacterota bacterium]